jgi:hypothetical protein
VIGGTTQGSGYTLDAAEANRILADTLTIFAPPAGNGANRAPDVLVRDVTLDGGRLTNLRLVAPGIVQVEGALMLANAGAGHSITIHGGSPAERVQVLTPGGSVRLRDSGGAAAGTLLIDARDIWVGDAGLFGQLLQDRDFGGRNLALLTPSATFAPRGYLESFDVLLRPTSSLFVQNSGTLRAFAGISVGRSLTIEAGGQQGPAEVYAFGRRVGPLGDASGIPFFFEVTYRGAFSNSSEFNTCIINPRVCPSSGIGFPGDGIEPPVDPESGGPGRLPRPVALDDLISEATMTEPLIEEPVTSGGDSSSWIEDDVDEEEEEEEEGEQPIVAVPAGGRR